MVIRPDATVRRVLTVGLTGGIGSGKSTVAEMFARRGAHIIDADVIARQVVERGTEGFDRVVDCFGPAVLDDTGNIDRRLLARLVFANDKARKELESIVHPLVRIEAAGQLAALGKDDGVAVMVVPLLIESGQYKVDRIVVVDCDEQVAVERVMKSRGWSEYEVRVRMATQLPRGERVAEADYIIDNTRSPESLEQQVDRCWTWLVA